MSKLKFFPSVCCVAVFCFAAFGQTTTGSLLGTVSDPANAAVSGLPVQITGQATGAVRTAVTDGTGLFRFPNLERAPTL